MQPSDMERNEFIRKLEEEISQFEQEMQQAVERDDGNTLGTLIEGWRLAQENWLLVARGMSPEKARAVMVGFARNELMQNQDTFSGIERCGS